jgi:DNA-binding transcriptional regulator YiaG
MSLRLRHIRQERGLAATELARLLQVSEWTVRSWEVGRTAPTRRHAKALARALAVEVEELGLEGVDEAPVEG